MPLSDILLPMQGEANHPDLLSSSSVISTSVSDTKEDKTGVKSIRKVGEVDHPDLRQPQIRFAPGDQVTVSPLNSNSYASHPAEFQHYADDDTNDLWVIVDDKTASVLNQKSNNVVPFSEKQIENEGFQKVPNKVHLRVSPSEFTVKPAGRV